MNELSEFTPWEQARRLQMEGAIAAARRASMLGAYCDEWAAAGLSPADIAADTWHRIPTLCKEALVDCAVSAGPFGRRLAVDAGRLAKIFVAPGPLYMPFTSPDFSRIAGSFAKALSACGFAAGDIVDQTTMYNWVIAASAMDAALSEIGCCTIPGGVGQSERHLEVIVGLGVNAVLAFPTFLEHLLSLAETSGRPLPLRKAAVMGELRDPSAKERIQLRHGIDVREFYGVADVGAVAWECEARQGMHLRDDLLVEFLEPGGKEFITPSEVQPAELVVTDLFREAMPIVRLRTGDLIGDFLTQPCPCGRTSPRFTRIVGRASESTKVKGMFVVPRTVEDLLRREGFDSAFCLVVRRDESGRDQLSLEVAGPKPASHEQLQSKVDSALRLKLEIKFDAELPAGGPRLVDHRYFRGATDA